MSARALLTALLLAGLGALSSQPARAACPSYTTCPIAPQTGLQPCNAELTRMIERASRNRLYDQGPSVSKIGKGCANTVSVEASFPCTLVKAIAYAESTWRQFCANACGQSGQTIISFDCGYGLTQVTSGMNGGAGFEPLRVAADPVYNLGAGMKILADKWRATPCVGDNQPTVVEDWYYATWAYNGLSWKNNPHNPNYPASRPPYNGPNTLSRGSYPYQEIIWGLMRHPPTSGGAPMWTGLAVTYPDKSKICSTQGCSLGNLPEPTPSHTEACQTTVLEAAELESETPANPIAAQAGAPVTKTWRLRNTGDTRWSTAEGYAFVRTSAEALGGPARVDLPAGASYRFGQTAQLEVSLTNPAPGSRTVTYQLQRSGTGVGPLLTATLNVAGPADADGDGHPAKNGGGDDCDDADPKVHPGATEECDGEDSDCSGGGDEALTKACSSACGAGEQQCSGSSWGACSAVLPKQESCNGEDDDCDGTADDGNLCPAGKTCRDGGCVSLAEEPSPGPEESGDDVVGRCGCAASGGWSWLALTLSVWPVGLAWRRRGGRARPGSDQAC